MEIKHNRNKGRQRMDEPSSEKTGIIDLHTNREIEIKKTYMITKTSDNQGVM